MKYVVTDEDVERAFDAMDAEFRKHFPAKIDSEDKALAVAGIRYALESFAQTLGEPVAVPHGWKPSDNEVDAWRNRNDMDMFFLSACRTAIDDARSMHLLSAPHHPTAEKGCE